MYADPIVPHARSSETHPARISRRQAIAIIAGMGFAACSTKETVARMNGTSSADSKTPSNRLPAIFFPHGGGPWPIVDMGMGMQDDLAALATYLRDLNVGLPSTPRAVLCISAHWEAPVATVMTARTPPMLYDYYGFAPEAYEFVWPAPGAPDVAGEVHELIGKAGFSVAVDPQRGFDHGAFVPLMVSDPDAKIPTFQLSLVQGLDPAKHIALGRALAPLRDEGVLIVGSGMSYHNTKMMMASFRDGGARTRIAEDSRIFDEWLAETVALDPSARETRLVEWAKAPAARAAHPREEHLLPLMVVAGAAIEAEASTPYRAEVLGAHVSAVHLA